MDKEKWIKAYTTGIFENSDKKVIQFIADFVYRNEMAADQIYDVFASGYCYYFAVMLKAAFNRGEICWHRNHGHIVWRDDDGIAYDVGGVFDDYYYDDLLPVETSLGDLIVDFKHNGEVYPIYSIDFDEWAGFYKMTSLYALSDIYRNMPRECINDEESVTVNAYRYWHEHSDELSEYYANKKHDANLRK